MIPKFDPKSKATSLPEHYLKGAFLIQPDMTFAIHILAA